MGGLLARLDLDGGAFMFEAEKEGAGMCEVLGRGTWPISFSVAILIILASVDPHSAGFGPFVA